MTIKEKHKGNTKIIYGCVVPLIRQKALNSISVYSSYDFPEEFVYCGITFHHQKNNSDTITFSDGIESITFEK